MGPRRADNEPVGRAPARWVRAVPGRPSSGPSELVARHRPRGRARARRDPEPRRVPTRSRTRHADGSAGRAVLPVSPGPRSSKSCATTRRSGDWAGSRAAARAWWRRSGFWTVATRSRRLLWVKLLTATWPRSTRTRLRLLFYARALTAGYSAAVPHSPYPVPALLSPARSPPFSRGSCRTTRPTGPRRASTRCPRAWSRSDPRAYRRRRVGSRATQARACHVEQALLCARCNGRGPRRSAVPPRRSGPGSRVELARRVDPQRERDGDPGRGGAQGCWRRRPAGSRGAAVGRRGERPGGDVRARHVWGRRSADGETLDLAPQPGMALRVQSRVGRVRASGPPVSWYVTGHPTHRRRTVSSLRVTASCRRR